MESNFEMLATGADAKPKDVTMLNISLNAGIEYNILNNHIAFGLLSHTKFCNTMAYSELTASLNFRPTNWLSATVSHTFLNSNRLGVFAAATNIHPAGFNLFLGLDYIDTNLAVGPKVGGGNIYLPRYQKSFNVYAGVGFNFGRPRFIKEAAAEAKAQYQSKRLERRSERRNR
jgi:hypothetical protein